ncbi:5-formyltetrahydrofolate cyclo-ligase [Chlamydia pneumoniae TW-183]|uniref:5-formyltetrahydrofolate cyclo-ligase n=2 Tax=Chlamydia pneumoniae TaxID=83558 RepID=Q9Z7E3_CHLPN|nr:5-formyltetrahydrofolate cyclo-ligase [Chlamydia pneumoniae]AAD18901.1 Formyltetrahydrofolate Cycloligase [Chlamydia pneumoniae CWL029]AAF73733.1 5-formyltetrahydrofolate cyclo-ligase, putative [Chlamydia pneumoniae AR39]AAP98720.1 5-formyltetrahydrofolate cyclo-ligase [Chlamydia pneumoniae TW-183]CRI33282.1 5-formyltetrahydrofolate cyclo-ligase [Chlamydia pneumoniae]CRI36145.1 5-formyltetrahydrofolate cyclo-ligase [Chlamydia pneumoniae]
MTDPKIEKSALRKLFISIRRDLSEERKHEASSAVASFVRSFSKESVVLSFVSFNHEIDMQEANRILIQKCTLALPKIDQENLYPVLIPSIDDLISVVHPKDPFSKQTPISSDKITHVLVPGLAFDQQGYRLGYGHGFYDRWLAQHPYPSIRTIGIGYCEQKIDRLPQESHDIPLSQIYLC